MRVIKFRLIRDGKIVGYEKHSISCGIISIFHSIKNDDEEGWEWWNVSSYPGLKHFINHDEKEQYTILHDKNGKEIYEGDIINNTEYSEVVYYEDGGFYPWECSYKANQIEVIGNIHEDKE